MRNRYVCLVDRCRQDQDVETVDSVINSRWNIPPASLWKQPQGQRVPTVTGPLFIKRNYDFLPAERELAAFVVRLCVRSTCCSGAASVIGVRLTRRDREVRLPSSSSGRGGSHSSGLVSSGSPLFSDQSEGTRTSATAQPALTSGNTGQKSLALARV